MILTAPCYQCRHFQGNATCAAFPVSIPFEIWEGRHQHREPYPGDGGLRFAFKLPNLTPEDLEIKDRDSI